jgi:ABC-type sugar transport system ATPase subunit
MLSGGNQQKVMLAKWLASGVRVLAIEEPTHGVDVGGKMQIHNLLREFADGGGSVVLASTDVHEVLELCDRLVVFRHGAVTATLAPGDLVDEEDEGGRAHAERVLESLVGSGDARAADG